MPISHALIAYQETVLAEASITDGTFRIIARRILPKIGAGAQKKTYAHEKFNSIISFKSSLKNNSKLTKNIKSLLPLYIR
jgi:hypothetical protein